MTNRKVLYLGGFELPDKNAAAQRVLSVAKALRVIGYEVAFLGITHDASYDGEIDGFYYESFAYPSGTREWVKYAIGNGIIARIKDYSPEIVILYNYPSIAQARIIRYCKVHHIKTIGDITEWYDSMGLVRKIDTSLRMRIVNKQLDGIIAISKYLFDYYQKQQTLYLPPLVDLEEAKWSVANRHSSDDDRIKMVYVGSPGKKDRLDYVIKALSQISSKKVALEIVGITKDQYISIYNGLGTDDDRITFYGRLCHTEAISLLKAADFQLFFRDNTRVNNAGFPTKYVESVSAGVAVITNRISNIGDYLINGINGFMIENLSVKDLVEVFNHVISLSKNQIDEMKSNSKKVSFDYRGFVEDIRKYILNL